MSAAPAPFTALDDDFHPLSDDPWETETAWFSLCVPERKMCGWLYGWVRPNLRTAGGGVFVWDGTGVDPWELPYFDHQFSQPLPEGRDLRDFTFPYGYSVKMLQPLQRYELAFQNRKLITVELQFDAIMEPHPFVHGEPPFAASSHFDQLGRVHGEITIRGERIRVDHYAMRDRSWGPRPDHRGGRIGYTYGTVSEREAFCVFARAQETRSAGERINHGFLIRDGRRAQINEGVRYVERDPQRVWITRLRIEAVDVEGRTLAATAESESRMLLPYPRGVTCNSFLKWSLPQGTGYGEDQDVWRYDQWREALLQVR